MPTLAKYLQGVSTVEISVECENGHALPAWHRPDLKNLQGTCEVSKPADLSWRLYFSGNRGEVYSWYLEDF